MTLQTAFSIDYIYTASILRIARTCQAAGSVILLYDHVINFDREVNHVWNQPFSFGSINYFLLRYIGDSLAILNMISEKVFYHRRLSLNFIQLSLEGLTLNNCTSLLRIYNTIDSTGTIPFTAVSNPAAWNSFPLTLLQGTAYFFLQSWLGILVLFLIQITLQVRLYALYHGSRKILAFVIFGFICEIAATLTILGFVDAYAQITNEILPGLGICANTQGPSFFHLWVLWMPVVVYDGILCLLAAWRGIRSWISGYCARRWDGVHVADVLIKDNVGYFLCILLICLASVAFAQSFGVVWMEVSEEFPAPMEVVIGCRLILSLRSTLQDGTKENSRARDDRPWVVLHPPASHVA